MIMKFRRKCKYWMLKITYLRQQHQCDRKKNWKFIYRRIIHSKMGIRGFEDKEWQKRFLWKLTTANLRVDKANKRRQINRMLKVWE